jgi:hypothetical protein
MAIHAGGTEMKSVLSEMTKESVRGVMPRDSGKKEKNSG